MVLILLFFRVVLRFNRTHELDIHHDLFADTTFWNRQVVGLLSNKVVREVNGRGCHAWNGARLIFYWVTWCVYLTLASVGLIGPKRTLLGVAQLAQLPSGKLKPLLFELLLGRGLSLRISLLLLLICFHLLEFLLWRLLSDSWRSLCGLATL